MNKYKTVEKLFCPELNISILNIDRQKLKLISANKIKRQGAIMRVINCLLETMNSVRSGINLAAN